MTVYLIGEPDGTLVKIGYTAGPAAERLRQLQTMSPTPLVLRAHWALPLATESMLHRHFGDRRRHGEWFAFDGVDPIAAVEEVVGTPSLPLPAPRELHHGPRRRRPESAPKPRASTAAPLTHWADFAPARGPQRRVMTCRGSAECFCEHRFHPEASYAMEPGLFTEAVVYRRVGVHGDVATQAYMLIAARLQQQWDEMGCSDWCPDRNWFVGMGFCPYNKPASVPDY